MYNMGVRLFIYLRIDMFQVFLLCLILEHNETEEEWQKVKNKLRQNEAIWLQQRWRRGNSREFGDAKGVEPKCCRPRGNRDEFLAPSTPELSLLTTSHYTRYPKWFCLSGLTSEQLEGKNSRGTAMSSSEFYCSGVSKRPIRTRSLSLKCAELIHWCTY